MADLSDLPPEMLMLIFQALRSTTFKSTCLTSKLFYMTSLRFLNASVKVRGILSGAQYIPSCLPSHQEFNSGLGGMDEFSRHSSSYNTSTCHDLIVNVALPSTDAT
jgi:hypothetical protein